MTTRKIKNPEKFTDNLLDRLNLVRAYHDLWAAICGRGLVTNHKDELNDHFVLAKVVEYSARTSFIIELTSLYDPDERSVTIQRYAESLQGQGKVTKVWDDRFQVAKKRIEGIRLIRNKLTAHSCESRFERNYYREANLRFRELTDLLQETWSLAAELYRIDDGSEIKYGFSPIHDLKRIFKNFDESGPWK